MVPRAFPLRFSSLCGSDSRLTVRAPAGPAALARAALIKHLESIPTINVDSGVARFPWDDSWTAYKHKYLPSMVLCKEANSSPFALPTLSTISSYFILRELSERTQITFFSSPNEDGAIDFCSDDVSVFSARPLKSSQIRSSRRLLADALPRLTELYSSG